jgi:hypothetical protein
VTSVLAVVLATVVLMRDGDELSRWPLAGRADLVAVDTLARLALAARQLGCAIRLRDADPDLLGLLGLVGLTREVVGQAEDGEQVGAEEVVVPDDPVA